MQKRDIPQNRPILKYVTFGHLILKNAILKEGLQSMSLFSNEFDRITFSFSTNEEGKMREGGQIVF